MTWPTEVDDRHVLGECLDTHLQIERNRLRDAELYATCLIAEALEVRDDGINAGRKRCRDVFAGPIAHDGPFSAGGVVADGDRDSGHGGARLIGDRALERGGRLGSSRGSDERENQRENNRLHALTLQAA
jgi:hypothetical protein